jgi:hypothetical protein
MNDEGPPPYAPDDLRAMINALRPLAPYMIADNVAPLVVYLASRRCAETHRAFSVGAGHISRVFIGTTEGWYAPGLTDITPEAIAESFDRVTDLTEFAVPESLFDELRYIADRLPNIDDTDVGDTPPPAR